MKKVYSNKKIEASAYCVTIFCSCHGLRAIHQMHLSRAARHEVRSVCSSQLLIRQF